MGMNKKPMADRMDDLIGAAARGKSRQKACEIACMTSPTFYRWIAEGESALALEEAGQEVPETMKVFRDFLLRFREAEDLAEDLHVARIEEASRTDWRASAWMLERHPEYRQRWSKTVNITGGTTNTLQVTIQNMSPQERLAKRDEILARIRSEANTLLIDAPDVIDSEAEVVDDERFDPHSPGD